MSAAARSQAQERLLVGTLIAGFGVLWFLFTDLSLASVDVHYDLSEMSVWAERFAFGYKHPPLSGWIFAAWFSVFPRADWAAHLLAASTVTATLAVTWRLLRDQLDFERALLGLAALALVPFYSFLAIKFNANVVQMPFWAGALLYYLRARRDARAKDAALAGAFAALAFLGKYWSVYLLAGMAAASVTGAGARRFWTSKAPYVMAAAALVVALPHLHWLLTQRGQDTDMFLARNVFSDSAPAADIKRSLRYLVDCLAYVAAPLVFLAALRPSRAAVMDTIRPGGELRRQSLILLVVPLIVPAFANIAFPHRLTAVWTFPNWAILPVVLYGSPLLTVGKATALRAVAIAAAVAIGSVVAAPWIAYRHLSDPGYFHRQHWRQLAEAAAARSPGPVRSFIASPGISEGLAFYLPMARPASAFSADKDHPPPQGLAVICASDDKACEAAGDALTGTGWSEIRLSRSYFGIEGPPANYRVKVAPKG